MILQFLLIVIMVSVVLFAAFLRGHLSSSPVADNLLKIGLKIPLMFPVAGLAYELIKLSGTRTFPAEAWIDKQGRLRRMKMAFKVKGQSLAMTMDLFDFGAREAIKAPPASDTKDVTDLATKQAASD